MSAERPTTIKDSASRSSVRPVTSPTWWCQPAGRCTSSSPPPTSSTPSSYPLVLLGSTILALSVLGWLATINRDPPRPPRRRPPATMMPRTPSSSSRPTSPPGPLGDSPDASIGPPMGQCAQEEPCGGGPGADIDQTKRLEKIGETFARTGWIYGAPVYPSPPYYRRPRKGDRWWTPQPSSTGWSTATTGTIAKPLTHKAPAAASTSPSGPRSLATSRRAAGGCAPRGPRPSAPRSPAGPRSGGANTQWLRPASDTSRAPGILGARSRRCRPRGKRGQARPSRAPSGPAPARSWPRGSCYRLRRCCQSEITLYASWVKSLRKPCSGSTG
jgi:hypothetical protein